MADQAVGSQLTEWLLSAYPGDLVHVVTLPGSDIAGVAQRHGVAVSSYEGAEASARVIAERSGPIDLGLLLWWPKIVKPPLLGLPRLGFINTHPSLLPHNRGKHYNFWALVEQSPFGVSLHGVEEGIDCGDIVAQQEVAYDWEDTGETLYRKAQIAMINLVKSAYPQLRTLHFPRTPQDLARGSFHHSSEIETASRIELDREYPARSLINLLRARTFPGHPACKFADNGQEYEISVNIHRKNRT